MGKKKSKLTQSQINGISWIAIALVISIGVYIFSRFSASDTPVSDTIEAQNISRLEKLEDSAYHSGRPQRTYTKQQSQRQYNETQNFFSSEPPVPTRKALIVELNSADTTTLQLLHGIGPTFARRIARYRERLGGFVNTQQLLEVYDFTPELLEHITPNLALDTSNLHKININSVTLKQFIKHPYVEYYFARDIINLRSRGSTFASPDDLRAIPSCTDTMLVRLLPYLDFK